MAEKKSRKIPDILIKEEQEALLRKPNPKTQSGLRNLCVIRLLLDTGITLSELLNVQPGDVDLQNGTILIKKEEDEKSRSVSIKEETCALLRNWGSIAPKGDYLFSTLKGGQLDGRYVREMVKRLAKQAGIKKNIYPHSLRHTFAAELYRETKDIRLVQKALGHADVSTTSIYADLVEMAPEEQTSVEQTSVVTESEKAVSEELAPVELAPESELEIKIEAATGLMIAPEVKTGLVAAPAAGALLVTEPVEETGPADEASIGLKESSGGDLNLMPEPKDLTQKGQIKDKSSLPKYVFKCRCGDIVSRQMERCPGCGETIEVLLEKMRSDFLRVNFGKK